jgi:dimethylaniline monooxygenase (N-oxide forming)
LSPDAYVKYLRAYAEHFGLFGRIYCNKVVSSVRPRVPGPGHVVTVLCRKTGRSEEHEADAVVVCSGLNLTPNIPCDIRGLIAANDGMSQAAPNPDWVTPAGGEGDHLNDDESWMNRALSARSPPFPKHSFRLLHSSTFKNSPGQASEFLSETGEPSTVVVLGAGETAHDISALAVNHPGVGRVLMCHRDGFFVASKVVPEPVILGVYGRPRPGKRPNKPIDTTVASLFDTAYVPRVLQRSNLLWDVYNVWAKGMFATISGTSSGLDQWVGGVSSGRRHVDSCKCGRGPFSPL